MVKEFGLPWLAHILLQIFVGPLWGAIIRIKRDKLVWGILYFITGGFIVVGWVIDVVTLILNKDYVLLA